MPKNCTVCFNRDNEHIQASYEIQYQGNLNDLVRNSKLCSIHFMEFIGTFMFKEYRIESFSVKKIEEREK